MDVRTWIYVLWGSVMFTGVVTPLSPFLSGLIMTGKTRTANAFEGVAGASFVKAMEVPKSSYTWFYLLGSVHNSSIALALAFFPRHPLVQQALRYLHGASDDQVLLVNALTILCVALFALHNIRRFLESLFVTEFGNSRMHASVLILGCIHYLGVVPTMLADPAAVALMSDLEDLPLNASTMATALGLGLYLLASYHQSLCNAMLASQKRANNGRHVIPKGDWFDVVRCPLYTTEIILYLSFPLVLGASNALGWLLFFWVLINQISCAKPASDWYDAKFRDEKPGVIPRWTLFPYIW